MTDFDCHLADFSQAVDSYIHSLFADDPEVSTLYNYIRYHLGWLGPDLLPAPGAPRGKRLRPTLCLLSCQSVGGDVAAAVPGAAALELIHNFSLVHDDIQDRSPLRRDRPSVWALWGKAHAITVGDALLVMAQLALSSSEHQSDPGRLVRASAGLNQACRTLCEGQFLDLEMESMQQISVEQYLRMVERKTAVLMQCACWMGALLGDATPEVCEGYGEFGRHLGMAFQIDDDLLDFWGEETLSRVAVEMDLLSRKNTLPVVLALEASSPEQKALSFADQEEASPEERFAALRRWLERMGAKERAEAMSASYTRRALDALARWATLGHYRDHLAELASSLSHRTR